MRTKIVVSVVSGTMLLVVGKVIDHYSPTVFPAVLSLASRPVPAWSLVLALCAAILCGYKLWNETNPRRTRIRILQSMGRGEYHVPTTHEEHVLRELYSDPNPVPTDAVRRALRQSTRVPTVQIDIAIEQLVTAEWVQREYVGVDHRERLKMTAIAYRHAEKQGYDGLGP